MALELPSRHMGKRGIITARLAETGIRILGSAAWTGRCAAETCASAGVGTFPGTSTVVPYSSRGRAQPMAAAPRGWEEIIPDPLTDLDDSVTLARVKDGTDPGFDKTRTG